MARRCHFYIFGKSKYLAYTCSWNDICISKEQEELLEKAVPVTPQPPHGAFCP
jgi:hypothetical protein